MTELLRFLADYLSFLFSRGRYRIVDSRAEAPSDGNAAITLESENVRIEIVRDRGQFLLTFQPMRGKVAEWFSPGRVRGVLTGDRGGSEALDPGWAAFLGENIDLLEARFGDPGEAADFANQLRAQARLRAKELFG